MKTTPIFVLSILLFAASACPRLLAVSQVAAPVFSPAVGTYTSAPYVVITSASTGASIRFTTDGSTPTETNGTLYLPYSAGLNISHSVTLMAMAYENGFSDSPVTSGAYTIMQAAAPVFSPVGGTYSSAQAVAISTTSNGASIRFTTDGSIPSETNGMLYSGLPVNISNTTFLKAIAYGNGFADSPVTTNLYTITSSPAACINVLYDFSGQYDGATPSAALVQSSDGNFYGTASGVYNSNGSVFKVTPEGVFTTLDLLSYDTNWAILCGGLTQGSDGNFYGTTYQGSSGEGTVFRMTPAGALTTLVSFDGFNGTFPDGGLIQASDGNFYGTTSSGGSGGDGIVFKMTPTGVLTTLTSFYGTNGSCQRPVKTGQGWPLQNQPL
jgi:uncharacterized repeat protein (TIGR03803 family)